MANKNIKLRNSSGDVLLPVTSGSNVSYGAIDSGVSIQDRIPVYLTDDEYTYVEFAGGAFPIPVCLDTDVNEPNKDYVIILSVDDIAPGLTIRYDAYVTGMEGDIVQVLKLSGLAPNIIAMRSTDASTGLFDDWQITQLISMAQLEDSVSQSSSFPVQSSALYTALSGKQETLVSGTNIKTVNGISLLGDGDVAVKTYQPFPDDFHVTNAYTFRQFLDSVCAYAPAVKGMAYLGEVRNTGLPSGVNTASGSTITLNNAEVVVEIMDGTTAANKVIHATITSGNVKPYRWEYTYWTVNSTVHTSGWVTWQDPLPSGTTGNFLQKTANGIDWASIAQWEYGVPVYTVTEDDYFGTTSVEDNKEYYFPSVAYLHEGDAGTFTKGDKFIAILPECTTTGEEHDKYVYECYVTGTHSILVHLVGSSVFFVVEKDPETYDLRLTEPEIPVFPSTISTYVTAMSGASASADGASGLVPTPYQGDEAKFLRGDGTWQTVSSGGSLPSQTGQSGKFLTTDGTDASWETVNALPAQTGNNGKFLTTNGTAASWATLPAAVPTLTWYTSADWTLSVDGLTLTIADTSSATLVKVYRNGVLMQPTADYTISGTSLVVQTALTSSEKITLEVY